MVAVLMVGGNMAITSCASVVVDPPEDRDTIPNISVDVYYESQLADMVESGEIPQDIATLKIFSDIPVDLSPISGLSNLKYLHLGISQCSDLSPLSTLTNLKELGLPSSGFSDLSPLSGLTSLKKLTLKAHQLDSPFPIILDLTPLSGLINLEYLDLNQSPISSIAPLSGLINLKELYLFGRTHSIDTRISDITPLSDLAKLEKLNLGNNKISDLTPLNGLKNLRYLDLTLNPLSKKQADTLQKTLRKCEILSDFSYSEQKGFGCSG